MWFGNVRGSQAVNINLLPWREAQFNYQKIFLKKMLIVVVAMAIIINIVFHLILVDKENKIRERMVRINEEIRNFSSVNRQKPEKQSEDFWREMLAVKTGMRGACFNGIEESDKVITFRGQARSLSDLTIFLRHWKVISVFSEMKIALIEEDARGGVRFVLEGRKI